jgi:cell wall-associated NlpC family hydrolase
MCPGSHCRASTGDKGVECRAPRESRECPGPSTEAELSRPSTRRVLAAGALALVAIAPIAESTDRAAEAGTPPPAAAPAAGELAQFGPIVGFATRPGAAHRASRSGERPRAAAARRAAAPARRVLRRVRIEATRRRAGRRVEPSRPARRMTVPHTVRVAQNRVRRAVTPRMAAVVAFALSQVGKRYVRGGEGRGGFDCSGFTKRAYAHAGLRLPHSSGAQAARARRISRRQARPGDLVVGAGHVGIYMGRGMMIDAGNRRTGVIYRHLYSGLHVARVRR